MSDFFPIQGITHIRGELKASPRVVTMLNKYLRVPASPEMFTKAEATVSLQEFHNGTYHEVLTRLEQDAVRALARHAFVLAPPLHIRDYPDGSGHLFFSVGREDKKHLSVLSDGLRRISGFGEMQDGNEPDMLYFKLGRQALHPDMNKRVAQVRRLNQYMKIALRDSDAKYSMTASRLKIVTRDAIFSSDYDEWLPR